MVALPFYRFEIKTKKPISKDYPKALRTLGDHLRKRRLDLNLTQKQIADNIGVDEATIWNWERNKTEPLTRQIPAIVSFLGYDPFNASSPSLADTLLHYRRSHGLSQRKLARLISIDPVTLSRLESGNAKCFDSIIKKVAAFIKAQAIDK